MYTYIDISFTATRTKWSGECRYTKSIFCCASAALSASRQYLGTSFLDQSFQKNTLFNFEKKSTDMYTYLSPRLAPSDRANGGTQTASFAERLQRSVLLAIIKKHCFRMKLYKTHFISLRKQKRCHVHISFTANRTKWSGEWRYTNSIFCWTSAALSASRQDRKSVV